MKSGIFARKALLVLVDLFLINMAYMVAFVFEFGFALSRFAPGGYLRFFFLVTVVYLVVLSVWSVYKHLWAYAGFEEAVMVFVAVTIAAGIFGVLEHVTTSVMPVKVHLLGWLLSFVLVVSVRFAYRYAIQVALGSRGESGHESRVLIVGAGVAGASLVKDMKGNHRLGYLPVGFVDDNLMKQGNFVAGIRVYGDRGRIGDLVDTLGVDMILIAIAKIDGENKKELIRICKETGCRVKVIPFIEELMNKEIRLSSIRDISIEDILGRDSVSLDTDGIDGFLSGVTVLVTGGAGSIGSQLCRDLLKYRIEQLVVFDSCENGLYLLEKELGRSPHGIPVRYVLGSVCDRNRVDQVMGRYRPGVVYHAAAVKHVPIVEENPTEGVRTNILGTVNVALSADAHGVGKFLFVSTDKAVRPTNFMGASKRVCELFISALNHRSESHFVAVRFGNVLGSSGSVVPLFLEQIKRGGPVTVTHPEVTRFFMTIPEASGLVIQTSAFANGGELFVLDMGEPVRIGDLAKSMIELAGLVPGKDIRIEYVGLRPGEKLYEETLMRSEGIRKTSNDLIFVTEPCVMEYGFVVSRIEGLRNALVVDDPRALVSLIRELVPEYVAQIGEV